MKPVSSPHELTPERHKILEKAIRLQIWTILYFLSVVALMYFVMGSSQAMKTVWIEDMLNMIPPAVFLISAYLRNKQPNEHYPYGYHRATSVAFLIASVALLGMGAFLLVDALVKLFQAEHPTIGAVELRGAPIWLGWLMYPVLIWGVVPAIFLGRMKIRHARELHDKTLYADALMCKANWLTGLAGMVGVSGIALGWWWLDAVAAAAISLDILHDGFKYTGVGVTDLMDRVPRTVDDRQCEALPARLETELKKLDWVKDAQVRLREHGHVFFGEAFLRPVDRRNLLARIEQALTTAYQVDWRLQELVVQLVSEPIQEVQETPGRGTEYPEKEEDGSET